MIQKMRSKRAGDYDEIKIKIGEEEKVFHIAQFTDAQKVDFMRLSSTPESYDFRSTLESEQQSRRAKVIWRRFEEWTNASHTLLAEVTNIHDKRFVVELMLVLLRLRSHEISDLRAKARKMAEIPRIKTHLSTLDKERNELLDKIARVNDRLTEQTTILTEWGPLLPESQKFESLIAGGRAFAFKYFNAEQQSLAADIYETRTRLRIDKKVELMQQIASPSPTSEDVAIELFDLFVTYNTDFFESCFKHLQRKQSAETAIYRANEELGLLNRELAELDEKIAHSSSVLAEYEKIKL